MKAAITAFAILLGTAPLALAAANDTSASSTMPGQSDPNLTVTASDTQQTVKDKLQKDGYTDVSSLTQDQDGWHGTAKKGGKEVEVYIDNLIKISSEIGHRPS